MIKNSDRRLDMNAENDEVLNSKIKTLGESIQRTHSEINDLGWFKNWLVEILFDPFVSLWNENSFCWISILIQLIGWPLIGSPIKTDLKPIKENKVTTKEKLTAVVRIIETRLESNEKETRDLENQMIEEIEKVDEKIDQINSSLDDIENKNTKMDQRFRIVLFLLIHSQIAK